MRRAQIPDRFKPTWGHGGRGRWGWFASAVLDHPTSGEPMILVGILPRSQSNGRPQVAKARHVELTRDDALALRNRLDTLIDQLESR